VTGFFRNTLILGTTTLTSEGGNDVYVASLDNTGKYRWAVRAGGSDDDGSNSLSLDAQSNVYITGEYQGGKAQFGSIAVTSASSRYGNSLFVAKLSSAGIWLQASSAGGPGDTYTSGVALAVNKAGEVHVTGLFSGTVTFGTTSLVCRGDYGAFVAKLDTNGTWQWAVVAGGSIYDFGRAIALDAQGNVYVAGLFQGDTAAFGATILTNVGADRSSDLFVAKLDGNGNWLWAVGGGSTYGDRANGIAIDSTGNVYVTGGVGGFTASFGTVTLSKSTPGADLFVAKLTANGTWQWATQGGGDGDDFGHDLAFDGAGNLMLLGSFRGSAASFGTLPALSAVGIYDIVVAQLSANGRWNWVLQGGGGAMDYGSAIALAPNGDIRVVGTFHDGTTSFGSTTLLGLGSGNFDFRGFVTNVTNLALRSQEFTLWPNPSRGTVWATGLAPDQLVQVYNAIGRLVASNVQGASQASGLALPPLRPGLYFVRAGTQTRRLALE
jgi:hypothetical protein